MKKKIISYILYTIITIMVLLGLFVGAVNFEIFGHLYSKQELKDFKNQTATQVFSIDSTIIGNFFDQNRTNINFNQIPEYIVNALVATEDARYFEHDGVDSRSLVRVLFKTIILGDASSGGGSTITQQLIKNMYGRSSFGPLTMPINKTKEALLAYRLESIYNKEEILALYLNTIPFGENVYGIEAASYLFFNKSVSDLSIIEGSVLIGMLKANTYYNPRLYPNHAIKRRNVVMHQMVKYQYITQNVFDSLKLIPIKLDYANLESQGSANYFLNQVKKELISILDVVNKSTGVKWNYLTDGLIIETTLDYKLQQLAINAFQRHLNLMQGKLITQYQSGKSLSELNRNIDKIIISKQLNQNAIKKQEIFGWDSTYYDSISTYDSIKLSLTTLHAGFLAIQPTTGEILAWVGGIDYRTNPYDQILAKRQMASTFKPILYAAALEKGISPCDYLDNTAKTYTDFENWKPSNYDHSEGGDYSLTGALIKSKNIPTVDLLFKTGYDEIDYLWRKLGFTSKLTHSPSMALGTADASLKELAIAYSAFANGGFKIRTKTILSVRTSDGTIIYKSKDTKHKEAILEPRSSHLMNAMLRKAINQGTGTSIRHKYHIKIPLAGKTGTSQNFGDAWFACYNPQIVITTRVGTSLKAIHFNNGTYGSGGKLALPLIALTLQNLELDSLLKKKYAVNFSDLPEPLKHEMNCSDFDADSGFDKLKDLFKNKNTNAEKERKKRNKKNKKRWFKRN